MSHGLKTKYLQHAHMLCSAPELMVEFGEVEEASEDEGKLKEAGHWGPLKHMPVLCTPLPIHQKVDSVSFTFPHHHDLAHRQWREPRIVG